MFGLFKKKEWKPETLPRMVGTFGDICVVVSNFPCRVDKLSGKRTYAYSDFGCEFINELHNKLGEPEQLRRTVTAAGSKKVLVKLRNLPIFEVEIAGSIPSEKGQFYSDIADALIDAFRSQNIKQ